MQQLVADYARHLADCNARAFADLFVADTGYFASGFRGHIEGRDKLVALVESERHCLQAGDGTQAARPGGGTVPVVALEISGGRVHGIADLGFAEYQDEYADTSDGWRFASRTVVIAAEKDAGLDAAALLAIHRLGGAGLADHYEVAENGDERLLTSGVQVNVSGDDVTGRAYVSDGGYRDEVYEQDLAGQWRVRSSQYVPPVSD